MSTRRSTLAALAAAIAAPALLGTRNAQAQTLLKQLTLVVGFPAGGGTDAPARLVAEALRGHYAETVIVDNRVGVAGRIAAAYVKDAPADGSVLLFTPSFPLAIFPHIYKKMPYDALKDFVPVATTSKGAFALSVGPAVPASVKTARDFVAWCKANPGQASYGAPLGSGQHFAGVSFARAAGIALNVVPYKGGAPSVIDALGGHIPAIVNPLAEVLQQAKDGKLRILATTTRQRSRFTPEVPTMSELGWNVVFEDWSGIVAPAGMPRPLIDRVNALVREYASSPAGSDALLGMGIDIDLNTPEAFATTYRATWEKYREVVQQTGFTAED